MPEGWDTLHTFLRALTMQRGSRNCLLTSVPLPWPTERHSDRSQSSLSAPPLEKAVQALVLIQDHQGNRGEVCLCAQPQSISIHFRALVVTAPRTEGQTVGTTEVVAERAAGLPGGKEPSPPSWRRPQVCLLTALSTRSYASWAQMLLTCIRTEKAHIISMWSGDFPVCRTTGSHEQRCGSTVHAACPPAVEPSTCGWCTGPW